MFLLAHICYCLILGFTIMQIFLSFQCTLKVRLFEFCKNRQKFQLHFFIQTYSFISFPENFPSILLFSPIFLFIFKDFSHLYFYLEPSSIRNSRVSKCQIKREIVSNFCGLFIRSEL